MPLRPALLAAALAAATLAPAADDATRARITQLLNERKWTEARVVLEKVTAAEPANVEAWRQLGQARLAGGDPEAAVAALEKAIAFAPADSNTHLAYGNACGNAAQKAGALSKFGWARKCRAAYEKAVELDPRNVNARFSLMEYYRQAPGIAGGDMEKAYAQAAEIRKLDAQRGRTAYAGLYLAEKKYAEAFALYEEVLRASPGDYGATYQVGRIAAESGQQLERGLAALRQCLAAAEVPAGQPGPAPVHWRMGMILERQGDQAGARAAYQASLAADPKFSRAADALKNLR